MQTHSQRCICSGGDGRANAVLLSVVDQYSDRGSHIKIDDSTDHRHHELVVQISISSSL